MYFLNWLIHIYQDWMSYRCLLPHHLYLHYYIHHQNYTCWEEIKISIGDYCISFNEIIICLLVELYVCLYKLPRRYWTGNCWCTLYCVAYSRWITISYIALITWSWCDIPSFFNGPCGDYGRTWATRNDWMCLVVYMTVDIVGHRRKSGIWARKQIKI